MLRNKCELVPMKEISYSTIIDVLQEILKKEQRTVKEDLVKENN
jgi:hypothetical protein